MRVVAAKQFADGSRVEVCHVSRQTGRGRTLRSTVYIFKRSPDKQQPRKNLSELTPRDLQRVAQKAEEIRQFLASAHPPSRTVHFSERTYRR